MREWTDEQKAKASADAKARWEAKKAQPEESDMVTLEADLQRIVDSIGDTSQERAHAVRVAFSRRGWPNQEHPQTVRDFLIEHNIPIV